MAFEVVVAIVVGFTVPIGAVAFFFYKTRNLSRDADKALRDL